jgi:uncharacterized membrane protein
MNSVLTILPLLIIPLLLKVFENTKLVSTISPIALAYAVGIALSFTTLPFNQTILKQSTEISIALSICLFVLASNLNNFRLILKPVFKSFILGILSLFIAIVFTYFLVDFSGDEKAKILGMLVGVYVGGTPNLNAIGYALEVPNETLIMVNTAEMILGSLYFFLLITVVKPILSLFLPKFNTSTLPIVNEFEIKPKLSFIHKFRVISFGLIVCILILGFSYGLVLLLFNQFQIPAFLIVLTTLSIISAQLILIKNIPLKFETADFLLLVFSMGIGMQIDFSLLFNDGFSIYLIVGCVFISTILIHYFLAWLTKTDVDTLLISSTAALYGPAFIAPVANSIKNKGLIIYGIALGLLGYILGNYLGLGVAWLLNLI